MENGISQAHSFVPIYRPQNKYFFTINGENGISQAHSFVPIYRPQKSKKPESLMSILKKKIPKPLFSLFDIKLYLEGG